MNKYTFIRTDKDQMTILIRFMICIVFLSEGIQKFLYAEYLGAGRFETIGIPFPEVMAFVVGGFEIVCGLMVLVGFYTRIAAVPPHFDYACCHIHN